jgi:putative ABC transport system ATP-binding protein
MDYIEATDLVRDFELGDYLIRAVDHVSIKIQQGEYIAIVGESGAGKTTFINLLSGLDSPTSGKIVVNGLDISHYDEEVLSKFRIFTIGFVFQNYNLISSLTALENVLFPMELAQKETPLPTLERRAKELLELVGMADRSNHVPFQLSAGEQQRVAIARALANDPPIIVADEPTANLDKKNAKFIAEMFEEIREQGKTIIAVTHDDNLIEQAHRVVYYEQGKIVKSEVKKQFTPRIVSDLLSQQQGNQSDQSDLLNQSGQSQPSSKPNTTIEEKKEG